MLTGLLSGCGPSALRVEAQSVSAESPAVRTVAAEWDDLSAAISVAMRRCACAELTSATEPDRRVAPPDASLPSAPAAAARRVVEIITLEGPSGTITIDWLGELGGAVPNGPIGDIRVEALVGRFGTPEIEACLVEQITGRLDQLSGVDAAPLRGP